MHSVIISWTQPDSPFPNRRMLREGTNLGSGTQSGVVLATMPCFSLISFLLLFPCPMYSGNRFQTIPEKYPSITWLEVSGSFLALDFITRMCNQDTEESHICLCSLQQWQKPKTKPPKNSKEEGGNENTKLLLLPRLILWRRSPKGTGVLEEEYQHACRDRMCLACSKPSSFSLYLQPTSSLESNQGQILHSGILTMSPMMRAKGSIDCSRCPSSEKDLHWTSPTLSATVQSFSFSVGSWLFAQTHIFLAFKGWKTRPLCQGVVSPGSLKEGSIPSSHIDQMSPQLSRCWK